jgi:REP element-mobilizing transposase RayT
MRLRPTVRDSKPMWIGLLGGAYARVRGRPPGRPFLPHDSETDPPVFLTWRLHDSLPCHRAFAASRGHCVLNAFVTMPNHIHRLATPALALPKLTKSLKGIASKRANLILAMTGSCSWQEARYGHLVRNERQFEKIRSHIEENPVRAGWVPRGAPADRGVRPTAAQRLSVHGTLSFSRLAGTPANRSLLRRTPSAGSQWRSGCRSMLSWHV